MKYRGYNPDREVAEKQLRDAYSTVLWVYESAMKEGCLSDEDREIVKEIEEKMSVLLRKLRNSNENQQ